MSWARKPKANYLGPYYLWQVLIDTFLDQSQWYQPLCSYNCKTHLSTNHKGTVGVLEGTQDIQGPHSEGISREERNVDLGI